jgi:hypothetical protein
MEPTRKGQVEFLLTDIRHRRQQCREIVDKGGDVTQTIPAKWCAQSMAAFERIVRAQPESDVLIHDDPILRPIAIALGYSLPNRTKN